MLGVSSNHAIPGIGIVLQIVGRGEQTQIPRRPQTGLCRDDGSSCRDRDDRARCPHGEDGESLILRRQDAA